MGPDGDRRRAGKAYTPLHPVADGLPRPEARREGKECRPRWSPARKKIRASLEIVPAIHQTQPTSPTHQPNIQIPHRHEPVAKNASPPSPSRVSFG